MSEYGSLIGWLIIAGMALALLNYPVKLVYRRWIARLDANSSLKKGYGRFQRLIVVYHRFFAGFALTMFALHVYLQLTYRWFSSTGIWAGSLLLLTGLVGGYGHYIRKKKRSAWLYLHRSLALLSVAAIIVHIVLRGR